VRVLTATGDSLTNTDDMRQIAGAFAHFEKARLARLVGKLKAARDRKGWTGAEVEGRKSHAELRPDVVALAKRLHRASPKSGKHRSLWEIAAELARTGHPNECSKPYAAQSVKVMLRA
jgi:hypothetical protein